jgi:hypothetical protein
MGLEEEAMELLVEFELNVPEGGSSRAKLARPVGQKRSSPR